MSSLLLLALFACDRKIQEKHTDDTESGPCALDDDACNDSLIAASSAPRALMAAPRANTVQSMSFASVAYSADTSLYRVRYALSKALLSGDTVYVRFRRDTTFGNTRVDLTKKSVRQRDSLDFKVAKVFGKKADYSASLRDMRKGAAIASRSVSWQTNFAAVVDTIPPVIDTLVIDSTLALMKIDVKPDSVQVFASHNADGTPNNDPAKPKTQQFCPLLTFADGKIALPANYREFTVCASEYAKVPLAIRSVSAKQQARADSACIKWEATGGTITAAACVGVPS